MDNIVTAQQHSFVNINPLGRTSGPMFLTTKGVHTTKIEALVRSRLVSFHGRVARRVHSPRREENQPTVSDMKFVRAGVLSCALYGSNWWYLMKGDLNACRSQICDASCSPGECGSSTLSSEHRQKHQEHTVSVREKENAYNL